MGYQFSKDFDENFPTVQMNTTNFMLPVKGMEGQAIEQSRTILLSLHALFVFTLKDQLFTQYVPFRNNLLHIMLGTT